MSSHPFFIIIHTITHVLYILFYILLHFFYKGSKVHGVEHTNKSLYSKLDAVKYYIQDLAPDIILFGKTWLSEAINHYIIHIPHYNIVRQDRGIGRAGAYCSI